jgi:hypothetical protein
LNEPSNAEKLNEAREAAGTDMVRVMQLVFPLVTRIQLEVIRDYGFSADGDGELFLELSLLLLPGSPGPNFHWARLMGSNQYSGAIPPLVTD